LIKNAGIEIPIYPPGIGWRVKFNLKRCFSTVSPA
jgi:hypothetical protein